MLRLGLPHPDKKIIIIIIVIVFNLSCLQTSHFHNAFCDVYQVNHRDHGDSQHRLKYRQFILSSWCKPQTGPQSLFLLFRLPTQHPVIQCHAHCFSLSCFYFVSVHFLF